MLDVLFSEEFDIKGLVSKATTDLSIDTEFDKAFLELAKASSIGLSTATSGTFGRSKKKKAGKWLWIVLVAVIAIVFGEWYVLKTNSVGFTKEGIKQDRKIHQLTQPQSSVKSIEIRAENKSPQSIARKGVVAVPPQKVKHTQAPAKRAVVKKKRNPQRGKRRERGRNMNGFFKYLMFLMIFLSLPFRYARAKLSQEQAYKMYMKTRELEAKGEYAKELVLLKKIYEVLPNMYVTYHLGFVLYKLGDCEGSIDFLNRLPVQKVPDEIRKKVLCMAYECRLKNFESRHTLKAVQTMGVNIPLAPDKRLGQMAKKSFRNAVNSRWFARLIARKVEKGGNGEVEDMWKKVSKAIGDISGYRRQAYERAVLILIKEGKIKEAGRLAAAVFGTKLRVDDAKKLGIKDMEIGDVVAWAMKKALKEKFFGALDMLVKQGVVEECALKKYNRTLAAHYKNSCKPRKPKIASAEVQKNSLSVLTTKHVKKNTSYRPYAYTTLGIAVAGLATGIYLLVDANNMLKDLNNNWQEHSQVYLRDHQDLAHTKRRAGWAVLGVGIASGVTSAVLFAIEPKSKVRVSAFGTPDCGGLTFATDF